MGACVSAGQRPALEALLKYLAEQGLLHGQVELEDVFAKQTLSL